ncbi:ANTAR domain-containing protein [Arthrobacter sp. HMWF013]|uniref:ANTAR domain-containing protein n=1 Tax=Arthrobacter sp. HMWF013 TaxID=2056849 RepID=UPI0015E812A6|nr:ANTAR domain-containing protein [Arthrobacter sp. HMWF013]
MKTETQFDLRDTGVLLTIRGHSEAALARSLARTAASVASDICGSPVESTVTLLRPETAPCTAATHDGAGALSRWEQHTGRGPTARALNGDLSIILNDHGLDERWPGYVAGLRTAGYHSAMAIPLQLKRGYRAALTLYAAQANVFAPAAAPHILSFSDVAAKSLTLSLQVRADLVLAAELRTELASRTEIDTACGVIMGQDQCSYEEALLALTEAAANKDLAVREVARTIILSLAGGVPATGNAVATHVDASTHLVGPAVMQDA